MKKEQRLMCIKTLLEQRKTITSIELRELFCLSQSTAYRDMKGLCMKNPKKLKTLIKKNRNYTYLELTFI